MATQAGQGRQPQVTGAASGQSLHEQRLVGVEAHNSHLVVEQLWYRGGTVNVSIMGELTLQHSHPIGAWQNKKKHQVNLKSKQKKTKRVDQIVYVPS